MWSSKEKKKRYWEPIFVVAWSVNCIPASDYIPRATAEFFIPFILIIRGKE